MKTREVNSSPRMVAETKCQICDDTIPLYYLEVSYPRICNECRKRLKKILYGESEGK